MVMVSQMRLLLKQRTFEFLLKTSLIPMEVGLRPINLSCMEHRFEMGSPQLSSGGAEDETPPLPGPPDTIAVTIE